MFPSCHVIPPQAVEAAFGQKLEEMFDQFDPEPVASGSIAQVGASHFDWLACTGRRMGEAYARMTGAHKGRQAWQLTTADPLSNMTQVHSAVMGGKRVAVKVRHPGVAEQIEMDFRLMRKVRWCVE